MRVEQLNEGMWAMTYLVVCEDTKKATLIDPVWDNLGDYLSLLEEQGLELEYAMATHTHADHITGCFKLVEMTGCEYVMWNDTPSLGVTIYVDEESSVSMDARLQLSSKYEEMWGEKWFMITNPMYGKWEGAIYNNIFPSTKEREKLRLKALNPNK